jgi:ABC-type lipoprotein export system ATPase subunit
MIELRGINKTYVSGDVRTPVLENVSLRIDVGEYVAIMGASGTGKTTLLNILGCLDSPTSGSYCINGTEVDNLDDDALSHLRNRQIGFVFQLFNLLERATLIENVLLPLVYAESYPADAEQRAVDALSAVGLQDRLYYRPNELSGGQQQRVAIARALINNPALILADEPTGNLDSRSGTEILAILQRLNREGRTILMVTHDRAVAEHADRILTLEDGRIAEERKILHPRDAGAELSEPAAKERIDESV